MLLALEDYHPELQAGPSRSALVSRDALPAAVYGGFWLSLVQASSLGS